MTTNVYEQSPNDNSKYIKAIIDEDGSIKFSSPHLSSANFDGYVPVSASYTAASALNSGDFFSPSGSTSYYHIIRVNKENTDWLEVGEISDIVEILYLDEDSNIITASFSSSASLYYIKEDWFGSGRDTGTSGWTITAGGNAIFSNVAVRGRIEATEGYIGGAEQGWEITENLFSNASVGFYAPSAFSSAEIAIFSGSPFTGRATAPFRVNYGGQMNATGASISGALTATTLNVGGSAGITYDGSIVTIGSSVIINSGLTANSLQVGASPTLLRIANDVEGTNDGIYIDPYNFWYSDGKFSVGGSANSACWNGSALSVKGNIIATSGSFSGDITAAAGRFTGSVTVGFGGKFIAGTVDNGVVLDDTGLTGFSNGSTMFRIPTTGSPTLAGFTIINSGLTGSGQNANIIVGNTGSAANSITIRGDKTGGQNAAIFTVQAGVATSSATGNGFYVDDAGRMRLAGSAGSLTFDGNNLSITGNINATSGEFTGSVTAQTITASNGNIAGFTLAKNQLSATNIILSSSGGFRLGNNNQFSVTTNGFLSASSASIVGDSIINGTNIGNGGGNISSNLRVGADALKNNTTGNNNTALGDGALASNTQGAQNIAIGPSAMYSCTTAGVYGLAIGYQALQKATTFNTAIAIGNNAMGNTINGGGNIAIGNNAMGAGALNGGGENITIGSQSLNYNETGDGNTVIGAGAFSAGGGHSAHMYNTAIGYQAIRGIALTADVEYNIALGYQADTLRQSGNWNTSIGFRGDGYATTSSNVFIGRGTVLQLRIDQNNNTELFGNLTVDTNTLFVDAANNRVGIGTVSPASAFHVTGSALFASNVLVSGQLSANNVNISGSITSASITSTYGEIAGWILSASALTAGTGASTVGFVSTPQSNNIAIYAGNATPSSAPFRVTQTGSAFATTKTSGDSSTSLATTAFVSNMIRYNGATSPTTASVAGYFVIAVSPGTSLNGCIMIPQGATGRTLNALVDRGINGAASAGYIRGYVESSAGAAIATGNSVPIYYMAW